MPHTANISCSDHAPVSAQAIAIYAEQGGTFGPMAAALWAETGLDFERLCEATGFEGRAGHMIHIAAPAGLDADHLLVLGGGGLPGEHTAWQDRGGSLFEKLENLDVTEAAVVIDDAHATPDTIASLAAGMRLRSYHFGKYQTRKPKRPQMDITLHVQQIAGVDEAMAQELAVADGTNLARDLVNEPGNLLGPEELAEQALALRDMGLSVEVFDAAKLRELGMGAFLAVGQGAARPPKMVVLDWKGGKKDEPPLALIGKGIVFDSGGISIKPAAAMQDMKGDMGGAAAVLGLMQALASRKAPINVVGVLALAENMPDGNAFRPGDIVTSMSGQTIEVINTDAEGRLVLADALWYTQDRFKPRAMIDLATLTGAILVALGHDCAGLFTNRSELAETLERAGRDSGELVWHMPLGPGYDKLIESRFADLKNQGGRAGGASIAGQFLSRFVNDTPWAHIDIAATAFGVPADKTSPSWATGFGVALIDRFVRMNGNS